MREPALDIVRPIRCCVLGRRAPIVSRDEMRRHAYIVVALACWLSLFRIPRTGLCTRSAEGAEAAKRTEEIRARMGVCEQHRYS